MRFRLRALDLALSHRWQCGPQDAGNDETTFTPNDIAKTGSKNGAPGPQAAPGAARSEKPPGRG
jgi:hypothetical protein